MMFGSRMHPLFLRAVAGALAAVAAVGLMRIAGSLERLELAAWDAGLRLRPATAVDPRVVFIDETEEDLRRFGHPLSDATLAQVIRQALGLGTRVLGIDKFRDIPVPPGSSELDRVLDTHANVLWIYQFGGRGMRRIAPPLRLEGSARAGFNDVVGDAGGVVRRGLLYLDDGGSPQPSFPLILALTWLKAEGISPQADAGNPAHMRLGKATLSPFEKYDGGYVDADAAGYQMLLDYRGAPARVPRVTLSELLDGRADPALFRGRIAIFGASAESLKDHFETPFTGPTSGRTTGAELHGQIAGQLLRMALGESAPVGVLPEWLEYALLVLCCAFGLVAWRVERMPVLACVTAGGLVLLAAAWYGMAARDIWLPAVPLALGFLLSISLAGVSRAMHESRERAALLNLFSRHVSPEVVRELWAQREELLEGDTLRPRQIHATVLFADLRGYSTVAERLSPAETARWLNSFMSAMAEVVMQHGGVIRQFAGDAVMAVFGAPMPSVTPAEHARDAKRAVECAAAMCLRLAALNAGWKRAGEPTAGMRIGISSGPMVSCSIGNARRMEYTVIGDTVNVAARMQAMALPDDDSAPEACRILFDEDTRSRLGPNAECDLAGTFQVKGRSRPVTVYRKRA